MVSMWQLGHLSTDSGTADTTAALLLRGLGTGFLFVPINQAAFASLRKSELQQASGLLSLSRQLGGSFGIALLATFVQQHIQLHRVGLLTHYTAADGLFTQRLQALAAGLAAHGMGAVDAQLGALRLMEQGLMRQAMTMSYNDAFLVMLIVNLVTPPRRPAAAPPQGFRPRRSGHRVTRRRRESAWLCAIIAWAVSSRPIPSGGHSPMPESYALTHLRESTRRHAGFFANDLKAFPEAALTASPGGGARTPLNITAEVALINGYIAAMLTGEATGRLSEDERAAYFARFDTRENAVTLFQSETDRLLVAIDAVDPSRWGEIVPHPFGHEDTLYAVAALAALHMMYHDGQLGYNQTLQNDPVNHWF